VKFLIRSSCTTPEAGWGNIAMVDLDSAMLRKIVEWRDMFHKLAETDSVVAISFWDLSCYWYDEFNDAPADVDDHLLTQEQLTKFNHEDWLRVPDDFRLDEDERDRDVEAAGYKECRTEADHINIEARGITWRAHVKHADSADVETWLLPYDAFICELHGVDPNLESTCLECIARDP